MLKSTTDKQRKNREGQARKLANLKPFKPGQSGNPKGRPKNITLSEAYRRQLAELVPGDAQSRTFAEVIAFRVALVAASGDVGAAREMADRCEGKPRQAVDVDMTVSDWRELAKRHGLNESDVIREARLLIESDSDSSGAQPD